MVHYIVLFKAGNQICADAIVVEGEVSANESLLTGESDEITKKTNVSKEDWLNCLREICVNMDQFELLKAKSVFTSAKEASLHNREQSKSNSGISGKIA